MSAVEVTELFLGRIEEFDPVLRSFRSVDHKAAREQARQAERAVLAGEELGCLHGIPVALKEHLPVRGSIWHDLLTDQKAEAERDSIEAERLRAQGAIVFGSLVAQGANRDADLEPGNAWDLVRTPGGSSLGSASATAAALLPVSVCTDGRGSTRLPAAFSGTVGLRGTRGRVPSMHSGAMYPQILTDSSPMTRDVRDAALMLHALAGPDGRDTACLQSSTPDYSSLLNHDCEGMRLAWTDDFGYAGTYATPESAAVIARTRKAALGLESAGATIEPIEDVWPDPDFATWMVHVESPVLNERIKEQLLASGKMSSDSVTRAQDSRQAIWLKFHDVLSRYDFILSPTIHFTAPLVTEWLDLFRQPQFMASYTAYTAAANLLGWPAVSVPVGLVDGLPVSVQIMGLPDSEPEMLLLAQALLSSLSV